MNNRWCIISSPRSGSNYLEERIFSQLLNFATDETPALSLREFLHYEKQSYLDSKSLSYELTGPFDSDNRKKFRNNIINLIQTKTNAVVMRVFPTFWLFNNFDLTVFLSELVRNEFQIIYLNREIKQRCISLTFAEQTNLWHRIYYDNKFHLVQTSEASESGIDVPAWEEKISNTKVKLDVYALCKNYTEIRLIDYYINQLQLKFPGIYIEYPQIEEFNFAPLCTEIQIQKLYGNLNYSALIENFDECENIINWMHN